MARGPVPRMLRSSAPLERAHATPADPAVLCMRSSGAIALALRVWAMESLGHDRVRGMQRCDGTEGGLVDADGGRIALSNKEVQRCWNQPGPRRQRGLEL